MDSEATKLSRGTNGKNLTSRAEMHEIRSLAEKIIAAAQEHHRGETSIAPDKVTRLLSQESNESALKHHDENLTKSTELVEQAVRDRDLDKLRVFDKFNAFQKPYVRKNIERVINDLRSIGVQETFHFIDDALLARAATLWLAIFDEGFDKETSLYGTSITDEDREACIRTLRVTCLVAPQDVIDYLTADTVRAMNIAGERRITDHNEFIRIIKESIASPNPALTDGLL